MMIAGAEKREDGKQNCHTWTCSSEVRVMEGPAAMAWWTAAPVTKAASRGWSSGGSGVRGCGLSRGCVQRQGRAEVWAGS